MPSVVLFFAVREAKRSPKDAKRRQEAPRERQRDAKMGQRARQGGQRAAKGDQGRPKGGQGEPREAKERPKGGQGSPKGGQREAKERPRAAQGGQSRPKSEKEVGVSGFRVPKTIGFWRENDAKIQPKSKTRFLENRALVREWCAFSERRPGQARPERPCKALAKARPGL